MKGSLLLKTSEVDGLRRDRILCEAAMNEYREKIKKGVAERGIAAARIDLMNRVIGLINEMRCAGL